MKSREPGRLKETFIVLILFVCLVLYLVLSANGPTPFVYGGF